jgi:hypothetical protein
LLTAGESGHEDKLYYVVFNRGELQKVADESAMNEVFIEIRSRLERWMRANGDSLSGRTDPSSFGC